MKKVTRWEVLAPLPQAGDPHYPRWVQMDDGAHVYYCDYERLEQENAKLRELLRQAIPHLREGMDGYDGFCHPVPAFIEQIEEALENPAEPRAVGDVPNELPPR